jgi:dCTP deaminase
MILSDRQIIAERDAGNIIIDPFDARNLGSDTYDVRLGEFFYRESPHDDFTYDIQDEAHIRSVWGGVQRADLAPDYPGWPKGSRVIWISPHETILAHTEEFIGARQRITTKMFSRSSIGRSMLGVCKCAGRGDVGYFNRWTFEITSFSQYHRIPLRVGMRVAQIEFLPVGETNRTYGITHGKYQDGSDLDQLKANWKPEMMLPRLHKDWELKE